MCRTRRPLGHRRTGIGLALKLLFRDALVAGDYVALVSGQYTDCEQEDGGIACHQNVDNLFHQLDRVGLTWNVWLEGATGRPTGEGRPA